MILYVIVLLSCIVFAFQKNRLVEKIGMAFLMIFFCFGYMTGSDWCGYEDLYNFFQVTKIFEYTQEPGYVLLVCMFRIIGFDFWMFHILIKCFVFYALYKAIKNYNVNYFFFSIFFFTSYLFLFIDCPFRNLIAFGIFLLSVKYLKNRMLFFYILMTLLAVSFHLSAIIMLPIYFLYNRKVSTSIVILLVIISNFIAYSQNTLLQLISLVVNNNEYANERVKVYTESTLFSNNGINISSIYVYSIFILILMLRKKIILKYAFGENILNMYFLSAILYPLGVSFRMFSRFSIFTSIFSIMIIVMAIGVLKNKQISKYLISAFAFSYIFLTTINMITVDCRYVPYSSYLEYAFSDNKPSYSIRRQYNFKHSPYPSYYRSDD